jgi:hypothetical protein
MNKLAANTVQKVTFPNELPFTTHYLITVDTGLIYLKRSWKDANPHVDAVRDYDIVIHSSTPLMIPKSLFRIGAWYITGAAGAETRYAIMEIGGEKII